MLARPWKEETRSATATCYRPRLFLELPDLFLLFPQGSCLVAQINENHRNCTDSDWLIRHLGTLIVFDIWLSHQVLRRQENTKHPRVQHNTQQPQQQWLLPWPECGSSRIKKDQVWFTVELLRTPWFAASPQGSSCYLCFGELWWAPRRTLQCYVPAFQAWPVAWSTGSTVEHSSVLDGVHLFLDAQSFTSRSAQSSLNPQLALKIS